MVAGGGGGGMYVGCGLKVYKVWDRGGLGRIGCFRRTLNAPASPFPPFSSRLMEIPSSHKSNHARHDLRISRKSLPKRLRERVFAFSRFQCLFSLFISFGRS